VAGQNRKLQNAIRTEFIAANAVQAADIGASAVGTSSINDDAITNAKTDVHHMKSIKLQYDFALEGGDHNAPFIPLRAALGEQPQLPLDAVCVSATLEVLTKPLSGGSATISIGTQSTPDALLAATAISNAAFNLNAVSALSNAVPFRALAPEPINITIATAALTAGKFNVYVEYYEGGTAGF
tara:strand:+ start:4354 stop:4902 length:549 start_codon:yes stop_codon:yes gene_type:complete